MNNNKTQQNSDTETIDNIQEIAEGIFSRPPGLPNSIQLQLEDVTADIAEQEGIDNFVFNILYLITFRGIEILFGHKKVHDLTEKQYRLLNDYTRSYGYRLIVHANNSTNTPWELMRQGETLKSYQVSFEKSF